MKITIRVAQPTDVEALLPLVQAYYAASPVPHRPDLEALRAHIQTLLAAGNPLGGLLVAQREGRLVGFAFLYYRFDKRTLRRVVHLNDLFVAATARRQGVARQLMLAVFEWAKAQGAIKVDWETRTSNTGAQALYEQVGERERGWLHYDHLLS